MKVYLTKTWGFGFDTFPALSFSEKGNRDGLLRTYKEGDWIAIAGTLSAPTAPEERGRLLGMVQVSRTIVDANEWAKTHYAGFTELFDENGNYKWPYGLRITRVVRFDETPDLKEVVGDYLTGLVWAATARDVGKHIGEEAKEAILSLPNTEQAVSLPEDLSREAIGAEAVFNARNTYTYTGPLPSFSRKAHCREDDGGFAYALRFFRDGKPTNAFKIGSTNDVERRFSEHMKGICTPLTKSHWEVFLYMGFQSERTAFDFEQALLSEFASMKIDDEREIVRVASDDLQIAWQVLLKSADWTKT